MGILTDDEYSVLMIAAQGNSMAPIGRWEQPTRHLAEMGYMREADPVNFFITPEGRIAMEHHQDEVETDWAKAMIGAHNQRVTTKPRKEIEATEAVVAIVETHECPNCGYQWQKRVR